ncbi:MAG: insulinase family protein, partial [Acidobacteriia bacterium]|nr:insulinase family protein [Terriglobia bacterium]
MFARKIPSRLLTFCLLASAGPLLSQPLAISAHNLSNGMRVLIHPDHDIPNVALYLFFKVGSRNERPGVTGMSHFFEHMMFNGAKKYGPKQFDIQMEKNGGRNNAYTSRDVTVYTDWFPKASLEMMFDMEADRIRDLAFDPKIIESERGVVYSERRSSVDNSNFGLLYEQLNAAAFMAHPYGWPVVGWASDIEAWTIDDLKQHFRMGYAPNNCVLVVAGDVEEQDVLRLARKYLEPIARQDPPPPVRTLEPPQLGERRVTVRKAAQLPLLMLSYPVPASKHPDRFPLEMLAAVLTQGRSSRLHRSLVEEKQLTLNVNGGIQDSLDPGQFIFSAQARAGVDPAVLEAALESELARLRKDGITADELEKARNQFLVEFFRDWKTIAGKANLIGRAEV